MKSLVIYYSFDGNTRYIARKIAQISGADIMEIEPAREIPRGNLMKFFWGGRQVIMKEKPDLKPLYRDAADYQVIYIGTPVWAWSYTPALASFFEKVKIQGKKIALFCSHGGGKGGVFDNMARCLKGNDIVGRIDFAEPLKQDKLKIEQELSRWVNGVSAAAGSS